MPIFFMLIFSKLKRKLKPEVTKDKSGKIVKLEFSQGKAKRVSEKQKTPLNFFVLSEDNINPEIKINNCGFKVTKAEYCSFITKIDSEINENQDEIDFSAKGTMKDLYNAFGRDTKKKKETEINIESLERRVKRREYTFEEQIIPFFNKDAQKSDDIYTLEGMFGQKFIHNISNVELDDSLISFQFKEYLNEIKEEKKIILHITDCLYKLLKQRRINFNNYETIGMSGEMMEVWVDFLDSTFLDDKYLTKIGRDKMIVLVYILVLKLNNNNACLSKFPRFDFEKERVNMFLVTIGCKVVNDFAILDKKPEVIGRYKRRRTNR